VDSAQSPHEEQQPTLEELTRQRSGSALAQIDSMQHLGASTNEGDQP